MTAAADAENSAAIMCTFVRLQTMAGGDVRLVLDAQCSLTEVAAMGLIPGVPFAIARITKEASNQPSKTTEPFAQEPKQKPGELCIMACSFCKDENFWKWLRQSNYGIDCEDEEDAKIFIIDVCGVNSRKELDTNPDAAYKFHEYIRKPYTKWRDENANRSS